MIKIQLIWYKVMIRYKLKECMSKKQFKDDKRITMKVVAEETGIHRTTLSKIANIKQYKTSTDVLDRLCEYFDVGISDLIEYVKEENPKDSGN